MNWFYHDTFGNKQGPISDQELRFLVMQKKIVPETVMETDTGYQGKAGQIPGLFQSSVSPFNNPNANSYPDAVSPHPPQYSGSMSQQPEPSAQRSFFCTNCGNGVTEQAVACMNCGAAPIGHHKFCRTCGTSLNPEQVVCIKCGSAIAKASNRGGGNGTFNKSPKSKVVAGILALIAFGPIGSHKFYMGSWGWGLVYIAIVVATGGFGLIVTGIVSVIEGIMYLVTSDDDFARKYPPETQSPFRW